MQVEGQVEEIVAADLQNHLDDPVDAHDATAISVVPFSTIAATNVQAALEEVMVEASGPTALVDLTDVTGEPPLTGEAPVWDGDSFELVNVATQAELDAHVNDTTDAHDASAISVDSTTLVGVGTDVQAVFEELDNAIADHLADTVDAHDASAISFSPVGTIAATDVQAAIAEVSSEGGGGRSGTRLALYTFCR